MTIEFFTEDCEKTVPKENRYSVKINEDSTITGVISAEYKFTPRVLKITGSNNNPMFMIITSSQKPDDTLVIINTTEASITGMWLASTNHSYCRACGELKPNSRYKTTWVNSGQNTYWTSPTYLSPFEYYICKSLGTACDIEYVKPEGQFYTDKKNCEATCLPPPPSTYYQCDLSLGVCSKTTEKTEFQDEALCNADCSKTPPPVYFQCDTSLGTCQQTNTKTEYTEKTACEQNCSKGTPSVYFQCDTSLGECHQTETKTEYTEMAACNKNCTPIPRPSPTHAPEKKSLWWIGVLVVFLVMAVVLLIVFLLGRHRKQQKK